MNKFNLSIAMLYASLCVKGVCAQEHVRQVVTMEEMFSLADRNSKSLRPSVTAIDEAREAVRVAKNDKLPDIRASLSFSYLGDGTLMERDFTQMERAPIPHLGNNFALEVSQVIYSGGAVSNGIQIARLQEESARLDWEKDRNKVRFLLAGYYFDLFKHRNILKVYEQNIEQTKQLLKDIKAKQGEGLALKNDITRYELLLSDLEFTVVQIRNTLGILNRNLVTNLGMDENVWIDPDTTILSRALPMGDEAYWREKVVENSPELRLLELAVQAAYTRYVEAYEQLDTRRKNVELAGQNYAVIQNRYKNELSLITDMLDASNAKLSAEVQLANAQIDIAFNYYKLLYLTGTL